MILFFLLFPIKILLNLLSSTVSLSLFIFLPFFVISAQSNLFLPSISIVHIYHSLTIRTQRKNNRNNLKSSPWHFFRPELLYSCSVRRIYDVLFLLQNHFLDLLNDILWNFILTQRFTQIFPIQLKMPLLDGHILMKSHHIGPLVLIGPSKLSNKIISYRVMQFRYVAHVFQPERVEPVI